MSLFRGKSISVEIYGESHAEKIGVSVTGFPEVKLDEDKLSSFLERRKASGGVFSTSRKEQDLPEFTGLKDDGVLGGSFIAEIKNTNKRSSDYEELYGKPRPSHADYCAHVKDGTLDFSGGGRFSGRMTAPLCVAGGVALQFLEGELGVKISAYLSSVGSVCGRSYKTERLSSSEIVLLREGSIPSLSNKDEMIAEIAGNKAEGDSIGAVVECVIEGVSAGLGDNLFSGLEGKIASLVYAIPGVKGVEFGAGFGIARLTGSEANDELYYDGDAVRTRTNNAGGINGGISNGEQITLAVAFRPTPSIAKRQSTVDLVNECNTEIEIKGRHDACIAVRAVPCVESAVALALLDEILSR